MLYLIFTYKQVSLYKKNKLRLMEHLICFFNLIEWNQQLYELINFHVLIKRIYINARDIIGLFLNSASATPIVLFL